MLADRIRQCSNSRDPMSSVGQSLDFFATQVPMRDSAWVVIILVTQWWQFPGEETVRLGVVHVSVTIAILREHVYFDKVPPRYSNIPAH